VGIFEVKNMSNQSDININKTLSLDGGILKRLLHAGLMWLKANQNHVNALNVFPVPDGDTGTNMVLTLQSAYDEIKNMPETNIGVISQAISQGALMGARGNSGVILSQLCRGFARALDNLESMDADSLVKAFLEAKETAYKGVVRPVEGTILTVAKDTADTLANSVTNASTIDEILTSILNAAAKSVDNTPNLLPILKQAGVVDSGGKGLYFILEGAVKWLRNEEFETAPVEVLPIANLADMEETIEPGQDFEVVIDFRPNTQFNLRSYYDELEKIGTSIQVGEGDNLYRMHIHVPTDHRYLPIDYTMTQGTITNVYIENLLDQMSGKNKSGKQDQLDYLPFDPGQIGVIATSPGFGISKIFTSLGASSIVSGGQTMNPSTEEILAAFRDLPTDQIIILPNNKNIILAAEAAASMSDKQVAVIPCKTVPQGISAMLRMMPGVDFDLLVEEMTEALDDVETGEITVATRTVQINGVNVEEGQVIALHNGVLIQACPTILDATMHLLNDVDMNERERITFFYGENISKEEVSEVVDAVEQAYPDHELEVHEGGQPHYQFIIAIE
jgi:uncharacterized protein